MAYVGISVIDMVFCHWMRVAAMLVVLRRANYATEGASEDQGVEAFRLQRKHTRNRSTNQSPRRGGAALDSLHATP